jgi:outer membrane protein TolC
MRHTALILALLLVVALGYPSAAAAQTPRLMTLAELVTSADQRNPTVVAARQVVTAAEAAVALAKSGRGPTFTASGSTGTSGGGTSTTTPGFSASVGIGASYVLYDSGQIAYAVKQAEANVQSAKFALEAARQDVSLTVATGYINVLTAQRNVTVREQVVAQNQELLRLAEGQFRAGAVARADVVSAQANLATAEGDLIAARNAVDQSKASLNAAIGQAAAMPVAVAPAPTVPALTLTLASLVTFVDERPEVRKAMADILAATAALQLAQAGGGLRLTLNGAVTRAQAPTEQTTYSVGATASIPVSDAGRTDASVAQASANLEAVKARIETARLNTQQQSVQAFFNVQNARARIVSTRAALEFALESLRLAQGRYAAGAGTLIEVTTAQTTLLQAQVNLAAAESDQLAGVINLRYALGRSVVDGAL